MNPTYCSIAFSCYNSKNSTPFCITVPLWIIRTACPWHDVIIWPAISIHVAHGHGPLRRRQMTVMAYRFTGQWSVCSTLFGLTATKHESSALLALCYAYHSRQKRPVTRKTFPFDGVITQINYTTIVDVVYTVVFGSCRNKIRRKQT